MDSFTDSILEQEFLKFRGGNDQPFVEDAILKMHNEKATKSFIKYGTEVYLIEFEDITFDSSVMRCYKFAIGILDNTSIGIGCVKNNESVEIIYSSIN